MNHKYIVFEGNIGAGKTTFCNRLAAQWRSGLLLERYMENPFLPLFYEDKKRYAFSVETSFLAERYNHLHTDFAYLMQQNKQVIADYSFYKSLIFAKQNLDAVEYQLFENLFGIINKQLPQPSLFVYFHTPIELLLRNIALRGRAFEQHLSPSYLETIEAGYMRFMEAASGLRCLVIDTTQLDFVRSETDYNSLIKILMADYKYGLTRV